VLLDLVREVGTVADPEPSDRAVQLGLGLGQVADA
jgi:hypothetical protein